MCLDGYVNCSNRGLENHFEDRQWLNVTAKEISFEYNRIIRITPFPKIIVSKIILRKNQISTIDRRAFKELVNLTELDLSNNQITSQQLQPHIFEVTRDNAANCSTSNTNPERDERSFPSIMIHRLARNTLKRLTFNCKFDTAQMCNSFYIVLNRSKISFLFFFFSITF